MGKKHISILFPLFVLLILIFIIPKSNAIEIDVVIEFEYDNYIYKFKQNDTREFQVNGTVFCNTDDFEKNLRYVYVEIRVYDDQNWFLVNILEFEFYSNESQEFCFDIIIPAEVENQTINGIRADGEWRASEKIGRMFIHNSGNAKPDVCNFTIYRPKHSRGEGVINLNPDPPSLGGLEIFIPHIIISIIIIIIIVIIIVFYRRKRKKELNEYLESLK